MMKKIILTQAFENMLRNKSQFKILNVCLVSWRTCSFYVTMETPTRTQNNNYACLVR